MYKNGQGVPQSGEKAVEWLDKAAKQGHAEAQYNLGFMLSNDQFVTRDDDMAAEWLHMAADKGHIEAQFVLGGMYFMGRCVLQNYEKAVAFYHMAAVQGNAYAKYSLAQCYFIGLGVNKNIEHATKLFLEAAEQGEEKAIQWVMSHNEFKKTERDLINMIRSEVFISYARKDKKYLIELKEHIYSLKYDGIVVWDDTMLEPGKDWKHEIEIHMSKARVIILLVSPNFFNSDFIRLEEMPELLQAADDDHAKILWIPLRTSQVKKVFFTTKKANKICIDKYQSVVSDIDKPLSEMAKHVRDKVYNKICDEIRSMF
jgi:hypothetical protein